MEIATGIAIGLIAGVPLTVLGAILVVRLQSQRMRLGYEILSSNVIIPKLRQANTAVRIAVRRSVLEENSGEPNGDEFVDIDELYGFRVSVENRGNVVLQRQPVAFRFKEPTRIVLAELESVPEFHSESADISIDGDRRKATLTAPFLNPAQKAIVSIQTVFNPDLSCQIIAAGPGLAAYDIRKRRRVVSAVGLTGIVLALGSASAATGGLAAAEAFSPEISDRLLTASAGLGGVAFMALGLTIPAVLELAFPERQRGVADGR